MPGIARTPASRSDRSAGSVAGGALARQQVAHGERVVARVGQREGHLRARRGIRDTLVDGFDAYAILTSRQRIDPIDDGLTGRRQWHGE